MPIRLVDGAMNLVRMLNSREEFYSLLDEIEEFYGHPENLDGIEDSGGADYGEEYFKRWLQEFTDWHVGHAESLRNRTGCTSVLDAGCGVGNIVRGFLRIGVDAWGLDISRYVVESCDLEIRGRILWGDMSKAGTLPKRTYDLVLCYDTVEHAPDPEAVVKNLCGLSEKWLHVKAPDIRGLNPGEGAVFDPTHITGRSIGWWVERFELNGFSLIMDERFTWLKWDPEYALAPVGAPDLHGLFKKRVEYRSTTND